MYSLSNSHSRLTAFALTIALALACAAGAQSSAPPGPPGGEPSTAPPETQQLAVFHLLNGNVVRFEAGVGSDDLFYSELGRVGTGPAFPADSRETLLDRYLVLAPTSAGVPRALVAGDPDGAAKVAGRELVEAIAEPFQVDFPIGGEEVPEWSCDNDTRAAFENSFCTGAFGGADLVTYCDSQRWWDLIRSAYRETMMTTTTYCGEVNSLGFGGTLIRSAWENGPDGWAWYPQSLAGLFPDTFLVTVWHTSDPSWKQARHRVWEEWSGSEWVFIGTLRGLTVFYN